VLGDRCRQRRLAMINMADRPYIDMWLLSLKLCLRHLVPPKSGYRLDKIIGFKWLPI